MGIRENIIQSLTEAVRKRAQSDYLEIPIYHKDSPIGRFISQDEHDAAIKANPKDPYRDKTLFKKIFDGVSRGRIGNAKNISYKFHPKVKYNKKTKQLVHGGTETGHHYYDFQTKDGSKVNVLITHKPILSARSNVKGRFSKSTINFGVNNSTQAKKKADNSSAVQTMRGVLSSVKHHISSHNPDVINFSVEKALTDSRDRVKLYKYLVNKLGKKNYDVKIVKPKSKFVDTQFFLYNKKSKTNPRIEKAAKRLADFRAKKKINRNKK